MKTFLAALAGLLLFAAAAQAQTAYPDLLVAKTGDTIRCAFSAFSETSISYFKAAPDGNVQKLTAEKSALSYYEKGFYSRREAAIYNTQPSVMPMSYYRKERAATEAKVGSDLPGWVIRVEGGLGRRVAKADPSLPSNLREFYDGSMRNGTTFGVMIGGYKMTNLGFGGRFEGFWTSGADARLAIEDKVSFMYVGADMIMRFPFAPGNNSHFYTDLGMGLMMFNETLTMNRQTVAVDASGIPLRVGAGFHIQLAQAVALHLGGNALLGSVATQVNGKTVREGVTRVGLAGGLSFTF